MRNTATRLEAAGARRSNGVMDNIAPFDLNTAIAALREGMLVVVPTDTVYGLAARASDEAAIAKLYALKRRPARQAISLLVADADMAKRYALFDARARALADRYWPGPLTMIMRARPDASHCSAVMAGGTSIGLRVPDHTITRALITGLGEALAVPSANLSGQPAPLNTDELDPNILTGAACVIEGGPCAFGHASTLVDLSTDTLKILREGVLLQADVLNTIKGITGP